MTTSKLHNFTTDISQIESPELFTYPFNYTPHALCVAASKQVQDYILQQAKWQNELLQGKMFGVLIVENKIGGRSFLAAFSGLLDGVNIHDYFVPPVYDLQNPTGYFKEQERVISNINTYVERLESDNTYIELKNKLEFAKLSFDQRLTSAKLEYKEKKAKRKEIREAGADEKTMSRLIAESQSQKGAIDRLKRDCREQIASLSTQLEPYINEIDKLKLKRKELSASLQQWLFKQFAMLNANGESCDLVDIFTNTAQRVPPAGSGECAAPKLLQYAYINGFKPIAMAEFWWGDSPAAEIRRHGHYYPACKGKCEPILGFMLQGLNVDKNPLEGVGEEVQTLEVIYEDSDLIVINKPAGLLSAPGRSCKVSAYSLIQDRYPDIDSPLLVHRLDMATSGLLMMALNKKSHKDLQSQFKDRTISKRYVAILDGEIDSDHGTIELPLCLDPMYRPRQKVDSVYGKAATTKYQVVERSAGRTRVDFYPLTGRTHQLRVHSAHQDGLNTPIIGDTLYGTIDDRLLLHAEYLKFTHPTSGEVVELLCKAPF